jgi:repressor LexA
MKGLTKRQIEILQYIQNFINTHSYSPSYREIMQHFGFHSLGTVYNHLKLLKQRGALQADKHASRSLLPSTSHQITKSDPSAVSLPFIGNIKGGEPITTFPQAQNLNVPAVMVQAPDKTYIFRIMGDALMDEHMMDGDLILVEARHEANPGETVLATLHHDEIVIKQYYLEGPYVKLISQSALHPPCIVHESELNIQGILVGLIRSYG